MTSLEFSIPSPVLVTGGAGFIGSHICKALAESGVLPICADTLEKGHRWAVKWGPLEHGDVGDERFLDELFTRYSPRVVIHLAGYIEVGESVTRPGRYLDNNTRKSEVLVDAALRHRVEAFVFSSTCAVYGMPQMDYLTESHRIAPLNPYASSKADVEKLLSLAVRGGLRAASLRYFNAAGADASGLIGEAHNPETHLVPLAIEAALGLRPPLIVNGVDYPTADGTCVRDYVHVTDLADAHLRAVQWLLAQVQGGMHEAFNLGSGVGHSVKEVIDCVGRLAARHVPVTYGPRRAGDSTRLVGNVDKARRNLGWSPVRNLPKQIEDALRWTLTRMH